MIRCCSPVFIAALISISSAIWFVQGARALPWWLTRYPLPETARSVVFVVEDAPIFASPAASIRRGSTRKGAQSSVYGATSSNSKCSKRWFYIGPQAWICEDAVSFDPHVIAQATTNLAPEPRYFRVGLEGAFGYSNLRLAEEQIPDTQLEPGFSVAVLGLTLTSDGTQLARTTHGFLIPTDALHPQQPSAFAGYHIIQRGGPLKFGWIRSRSAPVFDTKKRRIPGKARAQQTLVQLSNILGSVQKEQRAWVQTKGGELLRRRDVAIPQLRKTPRGVQPNERWIHVDLEEQTLVAYEGKAAVFATLVSTGTGLGNSETATPQGLHRIWVKLESTDMTNLEDANAGRYYAIESVPHVQFFKKGYGLHGAFWHNSFGRRRSHGCVNLSLSDAKFLFHWTSPMTPHGWHAVHPTEYDLGTAILVE